MGLSKGKLVRRRRGRGGERWGGVVCVVKGGGECRFLLAAAAVILTTTIHMIPLAQKYIRLLVYISWLDGWLSFRCCIRYIFFCYTVKLMTIKMYICFVAPDIFATIWGSHWRVNNVNPYDLGRRQHWWAIDSRITHNTLLTYILCCILSVFLVFGCLPAIRKMCHSVMRDACVGVCASMCERVNCVLAFSIVLV